MKNCFSAEIRVQYIQNAYVNTREMIIYSVLYSGCFKNFKTYLFIPAQISGTYKTLMTGKVRRKLRKSP